MFRKQIIRLMGLAAITLVLTTQFDGPGVAAPSPGTRVSGTPESRVARVFQPLQRPSASSHNVSTPAIEPTIDGAKTPERIPDYIAYRHFIIAMAEGDRFAVPGRNHLGVGRRDHPSEQRVWRRDAILRSIGFSSVDRDAVLSALKDVGDELDSSATPSTALQRKTARDQVFARAQASVDMRLSKNGRERLNAYLQSSKSLIKIFGELPQ